MPRHVFANSNTLRATWPALGMSLAMSLALSATAPSAHAQASQPPSKEVAALLAQHYSGYAAGSNPKAIFSQTTHANWSNCSANGARCQSRDELVGLLSQGLHKLVPDMKWDILDTLVSGDTVIVRGQGSGTPVDTLFGAPARGKSFQIMSIDIHTLKDGKIAHTHHLEDWVSALAQLTEP